MVICVGPCKRFANKVQQATTRLHNTWLWTLYSTFYMALATKHLQFTVHGHDTIKAVSTGSDLCFVLDVMPWYVNHP